MKYSILAILIGTIIFLPGIAKAISQDKVEIFLNNTIISTINVPTNANVATIVKDLYNPLDTNKVTYTSGVFDKAQNIYVHKVTVTKTPIKRDSIYINNIPYRVAEPGENICEVIRKQLKTCKYIKYENGSHYVSVDNFVVGDNTLRNDRINIYRIGNNKEVLVNSLYTPWNSNIISNTVGQLGDTYKDFNYINGKYEPDTTHNTPWYSFVHKIIATQK